MKKNDSIHAVELSFMNMAIKKFYIDHASPNISCVIGLVLC